MTDNRTFQTQVVNFPDRIILLGAALLIVAGTGAAIYLEMRSQFSVETFEQLIRSWGAWGVAGYRVVRALPERWVRDIPWFLRLRVLSAYLWSLAEWEDEEVIGGGSRETELALQYEHILQPTLYPGGISR